MLTKEDFKNPIDWVIYQVNGKRTKTVTTETNDDYTLSEAKYPLKFYDSVEGRCNVQYSRDYLCACDNDKKREVQEYFDEHFNGRNIKKISEELKVKHNTRIKSKKRGRKPKSYKKNHLRFQVRKDSRIEVAVSDKGHTHVICYCDEDQIDDVQAYYDSLKKSNSLDDVKIKMKQKFNKKTCNRKSRPKNNTYKESKLSFEVKQTGRVQVRVRDNGKIHTICSCSPLQVDEVRERYDGLKHNHDLDEIKLLMKKEFNKKINWKSEKANDIHTKGIHHIMLNENGSIYQDGHFVCVDDSLYSLVDKLLKQIGE